MRTSTPNRAGESSTIVLDPVKLLSSLSQLPASRSATAAIQLVVSSMIQPQESPRKRSPEADRRSKRARTEERECQICDPTRFQANLRRHEEKPAKKARHSHRQTLQNKLPKHGVVNYDESKKWRCSVCNKILASKGNLNRHYDKVHAFMAAPLKACKVGKRSDLRSRTPSIEREEASEDVESFMFVCECMMATESIDCAFEHAQLHLLEGYKPILQTCDDCQFTFEAQFFADHLQNHSDSEKQPVSYVPSKLLNTEWSDMFPNLSDAQVNRIKSLSIYEHTRKVKMNCDHDNGKPLYLCDTCEVYVHPNEVEDHCNEENACAKSQPFEHFCSNCEIFFYTSEALGEHEKEHEEGLGVDSFRTVRFNCKWDLPLNKALRQIQKTSQTEENSRADETSCPVEVPPVETQQCNRKNKGIEILSISLLCCGKFIPLSELEAHTATHAVYNQTEEDKEKIEEEVPQEQNPKVSLERSCSMSDSSEKKPADNRTQRTLEVIKSTEDTINQENNNSSRIRLSKATLEEANMKRDAINALNSEITTPSKVRKITGFDNNFSEEMKNELRQELQKLIMVNNSELLNGKTSEKDNFVGHKELYQRCEGTKNIEDVSIVETQNINELSKIHDISSVLHIVDTVENGSVRGNFVDDKELNQMSKNIEETRNTNELNETQDIKADAEIMPPETQQNKDDTAIPEELCDSSIKNESDESEIQEEFEASSPRPSSRYILSKMLVGNSCDLSDAIEKAKNDEKRRKLERQSFIEEARRIRNLISSRD